MIYYFYNEDVPLLLMAIYAKNEKADLSEREKKEFDRYAKEFLAQWRRKAEDKAELTNDIRASWEEALDYRARRKDRRDRAQGDPRATADAREARHKLGLSQGEFAALIGTGVGTVRKWELGTRRPSGAARTLIEVIKAEPKAVRRALAKSA